MKKKRIGFVVIISLLLLSLFAMTIRSGYLLDAVGIHLDNFLQHKINVPDEYAKVDRNSNGVWDPLDIVATARIEVENRTRYESNYYAGGYPPDHEGVCTDVIWRGFKGIEVNLKDLMDKDIAANIPLYPRVNGKPDPNIDFRRVPNQDVFFQRHLISLTTELIPGDSDNLKEWQPGDLVVFLDGYQHVGIVSDKRTRNGVPYLIQNNPPFASEVKLTSFKTPIQGHYRWKY